MSSLLSTSSTIPVVVCLLIYVRGVYLNVVFIYLLIYIKLFTYVCVIYLLYICNVLFTV